MAIFSERLNLLMKEKRVSGQKLADDFGVNRSTISRWRNGIFEPEMEVLKQLARYFNVSVSYLLGETDDRTKKEPIDLIKVLEDDELPVIDGEPISEEWADFLIYQVRLVKERILKEKKTKKTEISA